MKQMLKFVLGQTILVCALVGVVGAFQARPGYFSTGPLICIPAAFCASATRRNHRGENAHGSAVDFSRSRK